MIASIVILSGALVCLALAFGYFLRARRYEINEPEAEKKIIEAIK